jgi:tRNA (guanine6-N2)-methyltransferase
VSADILVRSVRGLEWVAADEVNARLPAAEAIAMSPREVSFRLPGPDPAVLGLRAVDDAFLAVGTIRGVGPTKEVPSVAARGISRLDWAGALVQLGRTRALPKRPRFDVVASLEGRHNYNRFALENEVGSALAPVLGGGYLARTTEGRQAGEPDLTVRVFVRGEEATVALRLADRPLHRRAYKQDAGAGTLHPPVAAALARLAGLAAGAVVADPFCGDGTIAIETGLSYPDVRVIASDIDPVRLDNAARNCARAGIEVALSQHDAGQLDWPAQSVDAVLTNPQWNVAVDVRGLLSRSLDRFWQQLPSLLTPAGRVCLLADVRLGAPGRLQRLEYRLALATQVRLAGRVLHVLLCAPPRQPCPDIPEGLARWRRRALAEGLVTEAGF